MDLTWIEDFAALAATGSFSRAAEGRHVTQPAFSRRIRALEDWLGAELFDRGAQPVALTEAGRRFRPRAEDLLRRLGEARDEARATAEAGAATLRFAATHALSLTFFPAWLRGLEPRLRLGPVQLVSDTLAACEGLMLHGRSQFLLCHHHPEAPGRLDAAGFRSARVGGDVLLPVAAPGADGRARFALPGAGAARGEVPPVLAYSAESGLGRILRALRGPSAGSGGTSSEPAVTSHLAVLLRAMALDGRGMAWLPRSLAEDDLRAGRLVPAGDESWWLPLEVRLLRRDAPEAGVAEALWRVVADATGAPEAGATTSGVPGGR